MNETIRHGLDLLASGQAQKEVTHNEALLAIDRQLHLAVSSRGLPTPPPTPAAGTMFIVPAGADGAWAGHVDAIAAHDGFGWTFNRPVRGNVAWIIDEAGFAMFDTRWSMGWPVTGLVIDGRRVLAESPVSIVAAAGGTIVDLEARSAIAQIIAALQRQAIVL